MLSQAVILAENFTRLGELIAGLVFGLPVLPLLSFFSSRRGRFPLLAIPAMAISLVLICGCLIARSWRATAFAFVFAVPLVLGIASIHLWRQKRSERGS